MVDWTTGNFDTRFGGFFWNIGQNAFGMFSRVHAQFFLFTLKKTCSLLLRLETHKAYFFGAEKNISMAKA